MFLWQFAAILTAIQVFTTVDFLCNYTIAYMMAFNIEK